MFGYPTSKVGVDVSRKRRHDKITIFMYHGTTGIEPMTCWSWAI